MPELLDRLKEDIKTAMKARDTETLTTMRMLHSSIKNQAIEVQRELTDEEIIEVLAKEAKKRRQSAQAYDDANRPELADKERAEIELIQNYLPKALTDAEVATIIDEVIAETGAESRRDMGKVMGPVVARTKGRYDASKIKDIVLRRLDSGAS